MFRPQAPRHLSRCLRPISASLTFVLLASFLLLGLPAGTLAASSRQVGLPQITAPAAILVEYPSGRVLYAKNAHKRLPEASTTKTMTALLALQRVALTEVVTATAADLVGESTMGLVEGEQQTVHDLLYGLLLPSGNDAAMALARYVGSGLKEPAGAGPVDRFVALMNRQAQQMGLMDTHYMNPHGFDDPDHYSSAYDLASIAWYDLHNPTFNEVISQSAHTVPGHSLVNTNGLLTRYAGADGVKTGWTDNAGNCLVASATRNGRRLIAVLLGEPHGYVWDDSAALFDYGWTQDGASATDTLTIARRAELLWFLATNLPTPLPTPRPTATPLPTTTPVSSGFSLPNLFQPAAPAPPAARLSGGGGNAGPAPAPPAAPDTPAWLWSLLAVPVGALLLVLAGPRLARRWPGLGPNPARPLLVTGAGAQSGAGTAAPTAAPPTAPPPPAPVSPATAGAAGRPPPMAPYLPATSTAPGAKSAAGKAPAGAAPTDLPRINLLNERDAATRAQRAIALAYRGQEGSSLAEFLRVVKSNPDFEFGTLPGFYDMPAAGYLALARAYLENDRPQYAAALLKLGRETYPDDRPLSRLLAETTV